ncbi:MAG: ABC transporter permease [Christensenellaceae bacterium]|nr:ABC transporter permease [Christensenellaceae bacterium]
MKQFFDILRFELKGYLKNKVFVVVTVLICLIIAISLSFPRIKDMFNIDSSAKKESTQLEKILIVDNTGENKQYLETALSAAMPNNEFVFDNKSLDEAKLLVNNDEYASVILIDNPTSFTYLVKNLGMYDVTSDIVKEIFKTNYRLNQFNNLGVSPQQSQSIFLKDIDVTTIETGQNQMNNFFYTYILMFMLYMAILIYGQLVATNVASEKSSRAMEILITSAKPTSLLFGKVIGSGLAAFIQMGSILFSAYIFFNLNKAYWANNFVINAIFNMPLYILLYCILFFVLGFFIYAFMFGAVGSMATKVEDINTSSMPITLLFIIAFLIVVMSMSSGAVDNTIMKISSFIPFTSSMAMFVRICMSVVPVYEIIISVVILILSTLFIGYISAKIYRVGVLLYGKSPKLGSLIKAMFHK